MSRRIMALFAWLMLSVRILGCDGGKSDSAAINAPVSRDALAAMVTGAARTASDGSLILKGPITTLAPQIDAARAHALAAAWAREAIPMLRTRLERDHGGPVENDLTACGRTYYAAPAVQESSASMPDPIRREYGPWWIFGMCNRAGTPEISLAVSAFATDLGLNNGRIQYPQFPVQQGVWFIPLGIRLGSTNAVQITPEDALAQAAKMTGRRIAAAPELVAEPHEWPQLGPWHFRLETPARLRTSRDSTTRATPDVYVGAHRPKGRSNVQVASAAQPDFVVARWHPVPRSREEFLSRNRPVLEARFTRRPDVAIALDTVTASEAPQP